MVKKCCDSQSRSKDFRLNECGPHFLCYRRPSQQQHSTGKAYVKHFTSRTIIQLQLLYCNHSWKIYPPYSNYLPHFRLANSERDVYTNETKVCFLGKEFPNVDRDFSQNMVNLITFLGVDEDCKWWWRFLRYGLWPIFLGNCPWHVIQEQILAFRLQTVFPKHLFSCLIYVCQ